MFKRNMTLSIYYQPFNYFGPFVYNYRYILRFKNMHFEDFTKSKQNFYRSVKLVEYVSIDKLKLKIISHVIFEINQNRFVAMHTVVT